MAEHKIKDTEDDAMETGAEQDEKAKAKHLKEQVKYTRGEEIFNWVSHMCGLLLSVICAVFMIIKASNGMRLGHYGANGIISVALFSLGLIAVYSISTAYHLTRYGTHARTVMRRIDHSTITVLIVASYMPYMMIGLWDRGINQPLDTIWAIIIVSIVTVIGIAVVFMSIYGLQKFRYITLTGYLVMGWMIIIRIVPLYRAIGLSALLLLLGGGLSYSVGVLFYKFIKIPYRHGIFHLFVLAGSLLMVFSIYFYLL